MIRGELSNRPAAIFGVDYRILLEEKRSYTWFVKHVPDLLMHKSFETRMKNALPFKLGAKEWIQENWDRRLVGVSIGVPLLARAIDMILGDYLAETVHFDDRYEYRAWLQRSSHIHRVYTQDPVLIGLYDSTVSFSGWNEMF